MSTLQLVLLLAGIAGIAVACYSGKDVKPSVVSPEPRTTPLRFGYFGNYAGQWDATKRYVSLYMIGHWDVDKVTSAAFPANVNMPYIINPSELESTRGGLTLLLSDLIRNGYEKQLIGLYWDEPDKGFRPDLQMVREVLAGFPQLGQIKMATSLADINGGYDFSGYDVVMVSAYDQGTGALTDKVAKLRQRLSAQQKLALVIYGADPWRTHPEAFYNYAKDDGKVEWLLAFTWFDGDPSQAGHSTGIAKNGLEPEFMSLGLTVKTSLPNGQ